MTTLFKKLQETIKKERAGFCISCGRLTKNKVKFVTDVDIDDDEGIFPSAWDEEYICEYCYENLD